MKHSVLDQISNFGLHTMPSTILRTPSTDFSVSFAQDTFSGDGLNMYAMTGENSPLPAWVSFDDERLTFSRKTPPMKTLVQPPQKFTFRLVASDVLGFSAASIHFSLRVGTGQLAVDEHVAVAHAAPGQEFSHPGPLSKISLDGEPMSRKEVSSR